MKKVLLTLILMLTVATGNMSAQQTTVTPEAKANISKILTATKTKETMIATLGTTYEALSGQLGLSLADAKELASFVVNRIYPQVEEKFIELWSCQFTPEEIKGIAAFYETPAGRKLGEKAPILAAEGAKIGASMTNEIQAAVMEFIQKRK